MRAWISVVCAAAALGLAGCDDGAGGGKSGFESDLPSAQGGRESGAAHDSATSSTSAGAVAPSTDDGANRAIAEADVIQLDGERLYALSRVAGLAIVDARDPAQLKLLGRYRDMPATPFEMYLRGDVAVVMFSGWGQYAELDDGSYSYISTSKVVALDVADPAAIRQLGSFDVPGSISDSRIVGDVLYVVSYEDGTCWGCTKSKPTTSVLSLDVSDPRQMRKVDQLRYAEGSGTYSWQRSVTVTTERMYVAGPEYDQNGAIASTIQVIDISDPSGDLVEGAVLKARGQIASRWQMDETDGVLRVVSQTPPAWRKANERPLLQTFEVVSSQQFKALARLDIVIPRNEMLQSARFDGARGYLITAERRDPLFTLDLSNPAAPRQVGELEMPGFVYHMEPRGDRLIGLGFDQGNPAGSITVSLFDVSDLAAPAMLARVNFGGNWGMLPEDQDRIHKVLRVLPDDGLILVPFQGYQSVSNGCGGRSLGGVQLIDYANDTLQLRGLAPGAGETRRALVHREHLLSLSDQRVESFAIADRDAPKSVSQVILANTAVYAARLDNDIVARVVQPSWDENYQVELVGKADASEPNQHLGVLDLNESVFGGASACKGSIGISAFHADGSRLYLLYDGYVYDPTMPKTSMRRGGALVVDASDASAPRLVGKSSWDTTVDEESWYTFSGDWEYGGFGWDETYLWQGSRLAFFEQRMVVGGAQPTTAERLRVIDFSDPEKPRNGTIELGRNQVYTRAVQDGDQIWVSHYARPSEGARSTRFFADAIDVSDPTAPRRVSSINVPGALVRYSQADRRGVTSQLQRVASQQLTYQDCFTRFAHADFEYADPTRADADMKGTCSGYQESLNLIELRSDRAVLLDSLPLATDRRVASWSAGDGVLFATLQKAGAFSYWGVEDACLGCGGGGVVTTRDPVELLVLGTRSDTFEVGRVKVATGGDSWRGFWGAPRAYASGTKALLIGDADAAIVDASDASRPVVVQTVELLGSPYMVDVREGAAVLAFGELGVQWVDL